MASEGPIPVLRTLISGSRVTSTISIVDLGLDVVINIMEYVKPIDIIRLRQTCKAVQLSTMQRTVWFNALRRMMDEHHIFEPTFDIQDMSQRRLEYATLSPYLFSSQLSNTNGSVVAPRSMLDMEDEMPEYCQTLDEFSSDRTVKSIHLVPGGRFLVTASGIEIEADSQDAEKLFVVELWDLGISSIGKTPMTRVSSMAFPKMGQYILAITTTPDGQGLRLISTQYRDSKETLAVHEIFPSHPAPEFKFVARLQLAVLDDAIKVSICGHHLAGLYWNLDEGFPSIVIWDFVNHSVNSWCLDIPNCDGGPIQLYDDLVVVSAGSSFFAWDIPPLVACEVDYVLPEHERGPPTYEARRVPPTYGQMNLNMANPPTITIAASCFTSNATPRSRILAKILHSVLEDHKFDVYMLDPHARRSVGCFGCLGVDTDLEAESEDSWASRWRFQYPDAFQTCDGTMLFSCTDEKNADVCVSRFSVSGDNGCVSRKTDAVLGTGREGYLNIVQLCAATGRLCILGPECGMWIIDYLLPPP
ncbi:hypothetical protein B0H34DRAFT_715253 [Crassisporium funariophilum]|nr:hypothetical protein B0H34DRAFT_715253 [Crassisporium funariophilum]